MNDNVTQWHDGLGGRLTLSVRACGDIGMLTDPGMFVLRASRLAKFITALYRAAAKKPPVILERPELPDAFDRARAGPVTVGRSLTAAGLRISLGHASASPLTAAEARGLAGYLAAFADSVEADQAGDPMSALYGVILDAVTDHAGSSAADESRYQAVARAVLTAGWKPPERET